MKERIHGAHSLTKTNSTSVETFLSPVNGLIETVMYGKTSYFRKPFRRHPYKSEFSLAGVTVLPRVDIVYACADMQADLIACSVAGAPKVRILLMLVLVKKRRLTDLQKLYYSYYPFAKWIPVHIGRINFLTAAMADVMRVNLSNY